MVSRTSFGLIGVLAIAAAGVAVAKPGVKDPQVKARMEVMDGMGAASGVIFEMVKGQRPFDAAAVQAALDAIVAGSEKIPVVFEPKATDPVSEASPAIWADWETFTGYAKALGETASATSVTTEAELRPALQAVGGACTACHRVFQE